ncbi:hypothetical protein KQI89_01555 [Clostridium sp. MSJ-4]|uniref:ABC-type uncharacterized transport system domain-containing protein n=1 Tax=Clostridium simiarum TaxID=2841506 RepID=A0ABS6EWE4_9CLOT|nr:hypothetical protein [Clostridium simiarum]MBU5590440.1 hypothetical protein [Clostridium simiarum]
MVNDHKQNKNIKRKSINTFKLLLITFTTMFLILSFSFMFMLGYENTLKPLSKTVESALYSGKNTFVDIKYFYYTLKGSPKKSSDIKEIVLTLSGKLPYKESLPINSKGKLQYLMNLDSLIEQDTLSFLALEQHEPIGKEPNFISDLNSSIEVCNLENAQKDLSLDPFKDSNIFNLYNTLYLSVKDVNMIFFEYDEKNLDRDSLLALKERVYSLKTKGDFLVLLSKNSKENTDEKSKISHSLIRSGADVIVYLDSEEYYIEQYKDRFIINGLPYLLSNKKESIPTPLYQLSIVFKEGNLFAIGVKVSPFKLDYSFSHNEFIPQLCSKDESKSLIDTLNKKSKNLTFNLSDKFSFLEFSSSKAK